jgi:hypothetical protein
MTFFYGCDTQKKLSRRKCLKRQDRIKQPKLWLNDSVSAPSIELKLKSNSEQSDKATSCYQTRMLATV